MEPRIQYATTADGVNIALFAVGEGAPLVQMPIGPFSHTQAEWGMDGFRAWYDRLMETRRLIRYDGRGSGLSQRNVTDFSIGALLMDLEAVVDQLGLERFALLAPMLAGPVGVAYAVRHPERLSGLFLWCSYARGDDHFGQGRPVQSIHSLIQVDWTLYSETLAHVFLGWSAGEPARDVAAYLRECAAPEAAEQALGAALKFDVVNLLKNVKTPTMVGHRRQFSWVGLDAARVLASGIPGAKLAILEGESLAPWVGDMEAAVVTLSGFLAESDGGSADARRPVAGGLRTVLFTDVEESTAFTQRLGDAAAREVMKQHERIVRDALKEHGGVEVKTMGDGFMASFGSAARALECAISMQRTFEARNEETDEPLRIRVGLNVGEPITEGEDLFGTVVIINGGPHRCHSGRRGDPRVGSGAAGGGRQGVLARRPGRDGASRF